MDSFICSASVRRQNEIATEYSIGISGTGCGGSQNIPGEQYEDSHLFNKKPVSELVRVVEEALHDYS